MKYIIMMCLAIWSGSVGAVECSEKRFGQLYNNLPFYNHDLIPESCRPVIDVREYSGDRFNPVKIRVSNVDEIKLKKTMNTIGWVDIVNDDYVLIYGNGPKGYGDIEINGELTEYEIVPEPVCESYQLGFEYYDCEGYRVNKLPDDLIYYGPDDTDVVTWEVGILWYDSKMNFNETAPTPVDDLKMTEARQKIDAWNDIFRASGVHVRLELKKVYTGRIIYLEVLEGFGSQIDVDVIMGLDYSYPNTCGVAYPNTQFREGYAIGGFSRCDKYTDIHELGHAIGLAHGPQNQNNKGSGYIFPDFGHGWNNICDPYDTIMSYGSLGKFFSNSDLSCFDILSYLNPVNNYDWDAPAGDRTITDEAYAINRVRYNVSLIHREHDREYVKARPEPWIPLDRPLIID